jgi:hypothetical protein
VEKRKWTILGAEIGRKWQLRTQEKQMATEFRINGQAVSSDAPPDTPLLWVIANNSS